MRKLLESKLAKPDWMTGYFSAGDALQDRNAQYNSNDSYADKGNDVTKDMKFDGGKILAGIPFQDFPRALRAVAEIGTFGAKKYSRSSWKTVDNAMVRYTDAKFRHILEGEITPLDIESGLLHKAHEAWNALATLELYLIEVEKKNQEQGIGANVKSL